MTSCWPARRISSRPATARPVVRPAPAPGSSRTSTPRRCRSGSSRTSAPRSRSRRPEIPMIDGGATLARRLDRYRSAIRAPTRDAAAPPTDDLAGRLATAVDGEIVRTSDGVIVRLETPSRAIPVDRALLATLPGQPPGGRPARLPRHRDDRAGHGGRHAGLADRGRLVGGGPLPPGPAAAAGQRRGALPARRARGDDPRLCLARHLQRARLRLAAAGGPLPARAAGRPGPCRSSRPAARRPAPVPPSHGRRPPADRRGGAARAPSRRRRRGLGDPRSLPRVPPRRAGRAARRHRPPQRPGRPLAGSPADADRERIRDPRGPAGRSRSATLAAWRRRTRARGASTRRWRATRSPSAAPRNRRHGHRPSRRSRAARPVPAESCRGGRPAWRPISAAHDRRRSRPAGRSARRRSRARGRPTGSPSSEPTCSAGSSAGTRQWRPGRASRPGPVGPPSWPPSSSPRSVNIGCVTRWAPCTSLPTRLT